MTLKSKRAANDMVWVYICRYLEFSSPAHQSSSESEGDKHGMYIAYAFFSYMTTTVLLRNLCLTLCKQCMLSATGIDV